MPRPKKDPPQMTAIEAEIKDEIYRALEALGAPYKLLATVGSWGDTLTDAEVLAGLKTFNETGDIKLDPPPRLS